MLVWGQVERFEGDQAVDALASTVIDEELRAATWVGDLDGDGADDIVGVPASSNDGVAIWYGGERAATERGATLQFDEPAEWFAVSGLGDLNGDGCDEFTATPSSTQLQGQPARGIPIFYGARRPL